MRSSRMANIFASEPLWYLTMSLGARCPMESYLGDAEGSDNAPESGSEVGYSVDFPLGGTGSGVGSTETGSLGDSRGSSSLS